MTAASPGTANKYGVWVFGYIKARKQGRGRRGRSRRSRVDGPPIKLIGASARSVNFATPDGTWLFEGSNQWCKYHSVGFLT